MILDELLGYPNMRMNCVDVKDCSRAHLRALERPEAANKRFILSMKDDLPMVELAN
jgi:nucleoside-diphosphate-sugar epimerase